MIPSYLIDTDWIIHYLDGQKETVKRLVSLRKEGLAISVISLAELYEDVYYSTNPEGDKKALDDFLTGVSILGIEDEICKIFGKERGKQRKLKIVIGDFDLTMRNWVRYGRCHQFFDLTIYLRCLIIGMVSPDFLYFE